MSETDTKHCEEHDEYGPCAGCQLLRVAVAGSGVITRSGKRENN